MSDRIPTGPASPEEIEQIRRICVVDYPMETGHTPADELTPLTDFERQMIDRARTKYSRNDDSGSRVGHLAAHR